MRIRTIAFACFIPAAFTLAACGSSQSGNTSAASINTQPAKAAAPAAQAGHYHAELVLVGLPAVTADGKDVLVTVNVTNNGAAPFGTQATPVHNVNLGAHAIDASGTAVDNDLARGAIPEVAPGATVKATILLPVDKVLGHSAQLIPVEEGVAWFNQWGTKPLVVGPFRACSSASAGSVCDASGKPLPVLPAQ
ncbi:MAG: hypothetical protein ACRETC_10995 [Gammaproteobacteria bacterium]